MPLASLAVVIYDPEGARQRNSTDMANNKPKPPNASTYAARFAAGRVLRRYRETFYEWQGSHYEQMEDEGLCADIRRVLVAEYGAGAALPKYVTSVFEALKHETFLPGRKNPPFWIGRSGPVDVFSCADILIDFSPLWTGGAVRSIPHDPAFFTTGHCDYAYDPTATCPQWLNLLHWQHAGNQEVVDFFHEFLGCCVLQSRNWQQFVYGVGGGDNGKSVVAAGVEAVLGPTNVAHVPLECIGGQFQTAQSIGKLCNIISDAEQTDKLIESRLKQHVGGDVMYHDRKFKSALEAPATTRILAFGNNVAKFRDTTNALPRRLRIIPFNVKLRGKPDRDLIRKITAEAPGILNEVIKGAARLVERGEFAVPQVCQDAERKFWMENHPVKLFFERHTRLNLAAFTPTQRLFDTYEAVMAKWGWRYSMWKEELGRQLRQYYADAIDSGEVRHRRASRHWVEAHRDLYAVYERPYGYEGIELTQLELPTENDLPEQEEIPF